MFDGGELNKILPLPFCMAGVLSVVEVVVAFEFVVQGGVGVAEFYQFRGSGIVLLRRRILNQAAVLAMDNLRLLLLSVSTALLHEVCRQVCMYLYQYSIHGQ